MRRAFAYLILQVRNALSRSLSLSFLPSLASFIFDSAWDSPRFFLRLLRRGFAENPRARPEGGCFLSARGMLRRRWRRRGWVAARARSWMGRQGGCQHRATNRDRFRVWVRQGRSPSGAARETPRIVARLSRQAEYWPGVGSRGRGEGGRRERARDTPFCWVQCTLAILRVQNRCSGLPQAPAAPRDYPRWGSRRDSRWLFRVWFNGSSSSEKRSRSTLPCSDDRRSSAYLRLPSAEITFLRLRSRAEWIVGKFKLYSLFLMYKGYQRVDYNDIII